MKFRYNSVCCDFKKKSRYKWMIIPRPEVVIYDSNPYSEYANYNGDINDIHIYIYRWFIR